jgi:two-component system, OmpR family, response regulator QseB
MKNAFPISKSKLLWLEDDINLIEIFKVDFELHFELVIINSLEKLKHLPFDAFGDFDCILLDMELSDGPVGIEVIEYLKSSNVEVPILMLSNDAFIESRLTALRLGVHDYMEKALNVEEIILRISNATMRNKSHRIRLGELNMQPHQLRALLNQENLELSKIEFQLITTLINSFPHSTSIDQLKSEVWRSSYVEIGTINTFVWKLNKKLNMWSYRISKEKDSLLLIPKEESSK